MRLDRWAGARTAVPARAAAAASLALLALFGLWSCLHLGWGERPWETAVRELHSGSDPYLLNLRQRLHTDQQTGWPYGPLPLVVLEPLYGVIRGMTGQARPQAFVVSCVILATAAHWLVVREGWRLGGGGWRGAVAGGLCLLNPFLLLLQSQGDAIDVAMLWLLLACVRAQGEGGARLSACMLGLSIATKQLGLLYLPAWLWAQRRRPDAVSVLGVSLALPAVPFLADPVALLFAYSGAASAYRNFVQLDWWNVFGYALGHGVNPASLRAVSWLALGLAAGGGVVAAGRRVRPLTVLTGVAAAAWIAYYSAYSLYLGWWTVLASVALAGPGGP